MSVVSAIPCGHGTVTPHLVIKGAAEAIEFYKEALGATEIMRMPGPTGKLMHAEIQIGTSRVYLADEHPAYGSLSPLSIGGTPVVLHLYVEDVDAAFARAVEAGATVTMPLMDMFWGDRFGKFSDPFGHHWAMAQHVEDVNCEEMADRGKKAMAQMCSDAEPALAATA
jgi:PhnB protein